MKNHSNCGCKEQECSCNNNSACDINKVEGIGEIHTKALIEMSILPGFPVVTREQLYATAVRVTNNSLRASGVISLPPSFTKVNADADNILNNLDTVLNDLLKNGEISYSSWKILDEIIKLIQQAKNPSILNMRLQAIEASVKVNNELSNTEKVMIIGASRIASASDIFWTGVLNDGTNPAWKTVLDGNGFTNANKFKINWADLLGFVVGCVGCSLAGGGVSGCIECGGVVSEVGSAVFSKE